MAEEHRQVMHSLPFLICMMSNVDVSLKTADASPQPRRFEQAGAFCTRHCFVPSHISNDVPLINALSKLCFTMERHPENLQWFYEAAVMVMCHAEMLVLHEHR